MSATDNVAEKSMMSERRPKFRFMDMEIWHDAIELGNNLFDLADDLELKKVDSSRFPVKKYSPQRPSAAATKMKPGLPQKHRYAEVGKIV